MGLVGFAFLGCAVFYSALCGVVMDVHRLVVPVANGRLIATVTEPGRMLDVESIGVIDASVNIEPSLPSCPDSGPIIISGVCFGTRVQVFGLARGQIVFLPRPDSVLLPKHVVFREGVRSYIEGTKSSCMEGGCLAVVAHRNGNFHALSGISGNEYRGFKENVCSQLSLGRALCDIDHLKGGLVGKDGNEQRSQHQRSAKSNNPGLDISSVGHTLRRFVHSSLSREVVYLPLTGFFFNALAGVFLGLFFHYLNRQRKWWPLLLSAGFACLGFWLIGIGLSLRS